MQEKVSLSSFAFREHTPLDSSVGSIGITLSAKYTDVPLDKASRSSGVLNLT